MNQLSILSEEYLAHTRTLRAKEVPAPLHVFPPLCFAARVLQPPDADLIYIYILYGFLGDLQAAGKFA